MDLIVFDTPYGKIGMGAEGDALTRLYLPGAPLPRIAVRETPLLSEGRRQLEEYFAHRRRTFSLPLAPGGSDFRRGVWNALLEIPYGETVTYSELARRIGNPRAVRAVGQANHHNPIPILIPCHRVVGARGALTGYAGGLDLKEKLLLLERG